MILNIAFALIGISVVGLIGLLVYFNIVKKRYKSNTNLYLKDKIKIKGKTNFTDIFDRFYQTIYNNFIRIPIIKYYTKKTRLKLEMSNDYTEYEIRKQAGKNMLIAVVFMFLALFILLNLVKDAYMSLIIILGVLIVTEKIIDLRVTSVSEKILRQMPEAFTNIRHAFHEHGMIEESFNEAIDELRRKRYCTTT
jgi:ABC-type multidrug transport system fused ATPase/permease subunit